MNNLYDLIIIGGGPSGLSAGIYAGRAALKTLLISIDQSGQIGITEEIVNYPGIAKISGREYMAIARKQVKDFGVEGHNETVEEIDFGGNLKKIKTNKQEYEAVGIIIATGATPRLAGFAGEDKYKGRGVGYCATCDGQFFENLDIFVVGSGLAACEESVFLTRYAKKVYMIVRSSKFNVPTSISDDVFSNDKIEVHFNSVIKEVSGDKTLGKAIIHNTETDKFWTYEPAQNKTFGIFVFAGYVPQSDIFKGKISMDKNGNIETDDDMKTNIDGVYAAGDIRAKKLRQLVTAVSDGAIAATQVEKYIGEKKKELGISINREKFHSTKKDSSIFDDDLKSSAMQVIEKFENKIKIIAFTDKREVSNELLSFLNEFSLLNDKVKIEKYKQGENNQLEMKCNIKCYPTLAIIDADDNYRGIQFSGIPSGHEFNSFIHALYNIAGPGQKVEAEMLERIGEIKNRTNIKIGVLLTCPMCPEVVQAAQLIASKNQNVETQIIDIAQFPEFQNRYNIMSVPCIVIDDKTTSFGKKTLVELLELLYENRLMT